MRKIVLSIVLVGLLVIPVSAGDFNVKWDNGFKFKSDDGDFRLKAGGRLMNDWTFVSPDDDFVNYYNAVNGTSIDGLSDGTEFRRTWLFFSGTVYNHIEFKMQYDFAGGDTNPKDNYIGLTGFPVGFKVGHFKEPFSLEELTSSKYITFMERGLPNSFAPGRNSGLMVYGNALENRMTWAGGLFKNTDGFGVNKEDGGFAGTARITGTPYYSNGNVFHIGAGYTNRNVKDETLRYRVRPETHLTQRFVDTRDIAGNDIPVEKSELMNLELAAVWGSFSFQGEYFNSDLEWHNPAGTITRDDPSFDGYYTYVSWWVTGEQRPYDKGSGVFGRVSPDKNFGDGLGALELALRYSSVDLTDKAAGVFGGEMNNATLGANWHLTPNARVMLNYIKSEVDNSGAYLSTLGLRDAGSADILEMRFQIDF